MGCELSITVLITAEIIALVYYGALQRCTASGVLEAICARILDEEAAHGGGHDGDTGENLLHR